MQIRDTTRRHGGGLGSPVPPPGPAEEQEDYLLATCTCPAVTLARAPTCPHQNSSYGIRVQTWNIQGLSCCGGVFNLCSLTQIFWDSTNFDDFSLGPVVGSSKIFKSHDLEFTILTSNL